MKFGFNECCFRNLLQHLSMIAHDCSRVICFIRVRWYGTTFVWFSFFFLFLFSTLANLLGAVALSNENDTQSKIHSCFNYVEGRHFRTTINLKKKKKKQCTNCFPDRKPSTNTPETSPVPTQPCTHLTIFLNHRSKSRRLFIIYLTRRIN